MLLGVQVGHQEQEVTCLLDWEEPGSRDVETNGVVKTLHGGPDGGDQLIAVAARVQGHWVHDELHVEDVLRHHPLDGGQPNPKTIGVKHIELFNRHEVLHLVLRHL